MTVALFQTDRKAQETSVRGRRGGEIKLDGIEDRAWLAALVIGEGAFYAKRVSKTIRCIPALEIAMQDEEAISRAAKLMGIRKTKGYISPVTGRANWRVESVGFRTIEIFSTIRSFLTATKLARAEKTIQGARDAGFTTRSEMREKQKARIMNYLQDRASSSTREVGISLGLGYSIATRYLSELEAEGKILSAKGGSPKRPRLHWSTVSSQERPRP